MPLGSNGLITVNSLGISKITLITAKAPDVNGKSGGLLERPMVLWY